MRDTLIELYRHQEWADAEIWRAAEAQAHVLADKTFFDRQHHIVLVQRAFLALVSGADLSRYRFTTPEDYATPAELKAEAHEYHRTAHRFLGETQNDALEGRIAVPWFKEPPLELTAGQALLQAALHSQHHRGQQASRLRELGATPPMTDYIVWLWKGRAAAQWT